ncbi:MFS transporter [Vibrio ponticus]|uniref:MFS transporter n=1 Tax=Vibrio ponticus TaxID=265668 RepID=A0A3N3DSZ1_9VIBR|nr:glycoside-pentoside-hexuronide (GPH):cation symporter [Vibrio ponticus]ROV57570.1 MFS transporter [Vibrio ponticus]
MKMLTLRNKLGYMCGDIGNNMSFAMSSTFLLAFYVDVIGLSAAAVGTLFLLARIWDGFNDPLMGTIAERRYAKLNNINADKFRPYLLKGSFLLAGCATLIFWVPESLSSGEKLAWAYLTYIAWGMSYTFVNIPYGSLASSMTQDAEEQASLSTFRVFGAIIGSSIVKFIVPVFLTMFANDIGTGYLVAMAVCGAIGMSAHITAFLNTKENIKAKPQPMTPLGKQVKQLFTNKLLLVVSAAGLICLTALYGMGAVMMFWVKSNLNNDLSVLAISGVIDVIVMIVIIMVTPKLIQRFGLRSLIMLTCLGSIAVNVASYFIVDTANAFTISYFFASIFIMIPVSLMWSMVSDCIEYSQYKTGKREAGVIYSSYSLARKFAGASAGAIAGIGVGLVGYNPELVTQTLTTQQGLQGMMFLMPAVASLMMFVLFKFFWTLTPEKREQMVKHNQAMLKLGDTNA